MSHVLTFFFLVHLFLIKTATTTKVYRRPDPINGTTLDVVVTLTLLDLSSIRLVEMDYRLDYYVTYEWEINSKSCSNYADKLQLSGIITEEQREPGDVIFISGKETKLFWIPDTYVAEVKTIEMANIPDHNQLLTLSIRSDSSCRLKYETRLAAIVGCKMDFHDYPYDRQDCFFRLRSHFNPLPLVRYQWNTSGVNFVEYLHQNHYEIRFNYSQYNSSSHGVEYSWLKVNFVFQRKLSHFLVQVISPTVIIIIIAYSSFWIGVDTGPARFILTVTTFLSLVTQFAGIKSQLPPVSYITAIDIWMLACMLFIFFAIMELAVVNYVDKERNKKIKRKKREKEERLRLLDFIRRCEDNSSDYFSFAEKPSKTLANKDNVRNSLNTIAHGVPVSVLQESYPEDEVPDRGIRIDWIMRTCYPLAFTTFNLIYWPLLLNQDLL